MNALVPFWAKRNAPAPLWNERNSPSSSVDKRSAPVPPQNGGSASIPLRNQVMLPALTWKKEVLLVLLPAHTCMQHALVLAAAAASALLQQQGRATCRPGHTGVTTVGCTPSPALQGSASLSCPFVETVCAVGD